jgi:hypothetical protein
LKRPAGQHARRKITDLHEHRPTPTTTEVLRRIGELYAIEAELRGEVPVVRRRVRQQRARPLLDSLEGWLRERLLTLSLQSDTTKAINYMLNQWDALVYYGENGIAEIDNNIVEKCVACSQLGKKELLIYGCRHRR